MNNINKNAHEMVRGASHHWRPLCTYFTISMMKWQFISFHFQMHETIIHNNTIDYWLAWTLTHISRAQQSRGRALHICLHIVFRHFVRRIVKFIAKLYSKCFTAFLCHSSIDKAITDARREKKLENFVGIFILRIDEFHALIKLASKSLVTW